MTDSTALLVSTVVGIVLGGAITFLIGWGAVRAKSSEHERRLADLEGDSKSLHDRISKLGEQFVGYDHFKEVVEMMKDNYKDLKNDLAKVLESLTAR